VTEHTYNNEEAEEFGLDRGQSVLYWCEQGPYEPGWESCLFCDLSKGDVWRKMPKREPFGQLQPIADGLAKMGFRLSRGTWKGKLNGKLATMPTLNIDRLDCQEWTGVWDAYMVDHELECALSLVADAIDAWTKQEKLYRD